MSIKTLDILLILKTKLAVQNLWKLFVIKLGETFKSVKKALTNYCRCLILSSEKRKVWAF